MISPELLRKSTFFGHLSEANLIALAKIASQERYEAGDLVFREGMPADKLYLILSGQIDLVIQIDAGGMTAVVDNLGSGDVVGWSTIVEPFRYTASGECGLPTSVVAIDSQALRELIETDHDLGCKIYRKVMDVVARRLHDTRLRLTSLLPQPEGSSTVVGDLGPGDVVGRFATQERKP
jgi:CRP-like cAMP-binding protein